MNNPTTSSSQTTRVVRCAGCSQENPSDRKFCGQCGGRLWQACLDCQAVNAVDEKFCGGCGVKLSESVRHREDEIKAKLELAIKLESEGRFYDAASKLREISSSNDDRLEKYQQNALQLLGQLDERRKRRSIESEQLDAQARFYHKQKQYVKAFESLKAIPVGLRSQETTKFMIEVEGLYKDITKLTAEIREALKAKQYQGLIPKVERLCQLQPENVEAKKLAAKLTKQQTQEKARRANTLAAIARTKLAERKYREAAHAVEQIDHQFLKGDLEQVYRQAKELRWLTEQLKRSPIATEMLLKVAKRWQKLVPNDSRPEKIAAQITDRLQNRCNDRRFLSPSWTPMPEQCAVHAPVQFWNGIGQAEIADEAFDAIKESQGRFMVAYGLALQGIGQAVLYHDLNPSRKAWGGLLSRRKKSQQIWGVDIGSTSVKAVELAFDSSKGSIEVTQCLLIPHARPLFTAAHDDELPEIVGETIQQFVEQSEAKRPLVALGFPGRLGLARFFDLPPIKSKNTKIEDAVGYEIKHKLPLPVAETVCDFHAWDAVGDGFVELRPISAIAARREDLQQWIAPVIAAGCQLTLLQCDGFALYNALHREFIARQDGNSAVAVVDIGGDTTNLIVGEKNFVWMRTIVHGVKRWDEALRRDLPVTSEQSEKLRKDLSLAKWMHQVGETLDGEIEELCEDIRRSLGGYPQKTNAGIHRVLGTGGGFSQFGVLQNFIHGRQKKTV